MKLKSKGGFTLTELLCVLIIVVLISASMVMGVQLATRSFAKSVSYSEAQVLCSTLTSYVSDELRYSGVVRTDTDPIGFFSQNFGEDAFGGFTTNGDGQVLLGDHKILPTKSYIYGVRAFVTINSYDEQTGIFSVSVVVRQRVSDDVLAENDFEVKRLNEKR